MTLSSIQAPYDQIHEQFGPFDPYSDVFFAFCPGFGFPSSVNPGLPQVHRDAEWGETLPLILQTKCPLFVTGFSPSDVERDVKSLKGLEDVEGQFDWILNPGENFFGSEKWDVADFDPRVLIKSNWGIWCVFSFFFGGEGGGGQTLCVLPFSFLFFFLIGTARSQPEGMVLSRSRASY